MVFSNLAWHCHSTSSSSLTERVVAIDIFTQNDLSTILGNLETLPDTSLSLLFYKFEPVATRANNISNTYESHQPPKWRHHRTIIVKTLSFDGATNLTSFVTKSFEVRIDVFQTPRSEYKSNENIVRIRKNLSKRSRYASAALAGRKSRQISNPPILRVFRENFPRIRE